jgi:peptide/nickel transport system permease protein
MRKLFQNPQALAGGAIISSLALVAFLAPYLSTHDPGEPNLWAILLPPSFSHLLGTDDLGRDVFSRMVFGSRISLLVGLIAVGISSLIGIVLGSISGFYGKHIDSVIMRFVDIMLCIPTFFLILAVIALIGPSIFNIMVVIGVTSWMGVTRLVRAEFLSLREREFVLAARAAGAKNYRLIIRHILPHALNPIMVAFTLGLGGAIFIESALSFLGIGVQPPTPSWGNILTEGKDNIDIAWWLSVFPGLAILITVLGFYLLAEGIREYSNPRLKR